MLAALHVPKAESPNDYETTWPGTPHSRKNISKGRDPGSEEAASLHTYAFRVHVGVLS